MTPARCRKVKGRGASSEPKPRSMAAVTITVNSKALFRSAFKWPLPNLAKCWNIWNVSPGARPFRRILVLGRWAATIRGVSQTISRKGHSQPGMSPGSWMVKGAFAPRFIQCPPVAGGTSDPWFRPISIEIASQSWSASKRSSGAGGSDPRVPTVVW